MTFWAKSLRVFNYLWEHGTQSVRRMARKTGFSNASSLPILPQGEQFPRAICLPVLLCSHYKTRLY
jgi:hypothetical protein